MDKAINFKYACEMYNEKHHTNLTMDEFNDVIVQYIAHHKGKKYDGSKYYDRLNLNIGALMCEFPGDNYNIAITVRISSLLDEAECYNGPKLVEGIYSSMLIGDGYKDNSEITNEIYEKYMNEAFGVLVFYTMPLVINDGVEEE